MLSRDFFDRDVIAVARDLIGVRFTLDGVGGAIVETEAYCQEDPASHSYRGRTPTNEVMFGPPGYTYVYRSYGIHWCVNIVCGRPDYGSGVLIRALAPERRLDIMRARRGLDDPRKLCAGPGRLCQALGITRAHNGLPLDVPPFRLDAAVKPHDILVGPRIGISQAREKPWWFGAAGSPFLSRPFPVIVGARKALRQKN